MTSSRQPSVLATLFRCELKMLMRDKRTILIAVVAPLVIIPAYILLLRYIEDRESRALEETTYTYALSGSRADWAGELVEAALAREAADVEADGDSVRAPAVFELRKVADPREALIEEELHLVVEGLSVEEWAAAKADKEEEERQRDETSGLEAGEEYGSDKAEEEKPEPPVPALRILYRADSDFSREARSRLTERLLEVREERRDAIYRSAGFALPLKQVAAVDSESVTTAAKKTGALLALALTPMLVLLMLSGGSIVAVDAISGEKERGTLETLLTTAADRAEIVRAKLLAVIVVGLAVAVINVVNLLVYLVVGVIELPESFEVAIGPLELLLLLLLFVPVAVLVAGALLLLSGASKSYKDYQVRFFPVFLAFLLPSAAAALPGIDLRSAIAFVPLSGVAVAVREILTGELDWPFLALAFASTAALALWLTHLTQETLSNEKLISGADLDEADLTGGPALFPRHVLRWFLGLWVLFFVVSLWFGEALGLRGQVLVNIVAIFFGGSLLMVRRYRLDPKEAFSLRAPHPAAWMAVLIGAPAALLVGIGLARLVNAYVFPVPREVLESFGRVFVETEMPLWQTALFLTVIPGIFEELAFRGVLLHGLRKRIRRRWPLTLAAGLIFGLFHVSLFRIFPTALLGFILAWVVLLSRSIYPAMAWHALNNAVAILPGRLEMVPEDFEPPTWWVWPALLGLAVSIWILWRSGRAGLRAAGSEPS